MPVRLDDVAAIALALPESVEVERYGARAWAVGGKVFAWERTFSKADIKRYGDAAVPSDPILAVRVDDLSEKEAVLAAGQRGFFTIPHFNGYAAILIELRKAARSDVREAILDGWRACAPTRLSNDHKAAGT